MFPYLSPEQRDEFEKALYPVLEKEPGLVTDGQELLKEGGKKVEDNPPADAEAFRKKMVAYEARLRKAMTDEDQAVGTIFDLIDAHSPKLHPGQ